MFNSKKLFKCLTLTFLFVVINMNIFASKNLEKKIKKLEAEVVEYEKKHLNKQNKKGYVNKNSVANITGLSKKKKKSKVIQKSKEINVEFPEYDPETKMVSVRNNYSVRIDARTIGSKYSNKIYLNPSSSNSKESNFENYVGSEEIAVENGNLILTDKNSDKKQIISDIESKLILAFNEELASEKSKLSKNNNNKAVISKNSEKENIISENNITNNKNEKKTIKKEVGVIVEGFDIINKVDAPI